jgi:hypothetical protein
MYAQNVAIIDVSRSTATVQSFIASDAAGGETDLECMLRDGKELSFAEAEQAIEQEHPNGTLLLVPNFINVPVVAAG